MAGPFIKIVAAALMSAPFVLAQFHPPQAIPEERNSVTRHRARVGGREIGYTATTGTYVIKSDDGGPKASMFYIAYTLDDVSDEAKRPLAFIYNGGPGSSSVFTHMGLGPRHLVLSEDGHGIPAPYRFEDNDDSLLDATDMIFIDAVSTGYSRPAPNQNPAQFYGLVADATLFSDFIYQYLTRNQRWASPKFLIGESYGTRRSAELSFVLQQRHQVYLNGITLISSNTLGDVGADERARLWLPSFVTSAWYHHLLPPDLEKLSLEEIAQQARTFAHGEYAAALEKGDELTPADHQMVVKHLARLTGLSEKYIEDTNLRITPERWFKEIERGKRRTVGRADSRFEGMDVDAAGERSEYDPSALSYRGSFAAVFQDYVHRELKWNSDEYYTVMSELRPWDLGPPGGIAEALRSAMTQQTHLKVLIACGYYDLATAFNGIEYTVAHMNLEPSIRKNISFSYYEAGHMIYTDKRARAKLHRDISAFIHSILE